MSSPCTLATGLNPPPPPWRGGTPWGLCLSFHAARAQNSPRPQCPPLAQGLGVPGPKMGKRQLSEFLEPSRSRGEGGRPASALQGGRSAAPGVGGGGWGVGAAQPSHPSPWKPLGPEPYSAALPTTPRPSICPPDSRRAGCGLSRSGPGPTLPLGRTTPMP